MRPALVVFSLSLGLSACGTPGGNTKPLLPDKMLQLTATQSVSLEALALGAVGLAALHIVYDPLAPNWEIEEAKLSEDTYRFNMKMKRYHTGGIGESLQILKRRARDLQAENGYTAYQLVEFTEGIDSATLGAQRVAEGTVRLIRQAQADSFGLNPIY